MNKCVRTIIRLPCLRQLQTHRVSNMSTVAVTAVSAAPTAPFQISHTVDQARAGILTTASGSLPTPNAFFYTKKGNLAHLTPDQLHRLPLLRGLHVPIAEFTHAPGEVGIKNFKNALHDYLQLPQHILYMTVRDPLVDQIGSANENGVSVIATQGTQRLTPTSYTDLALAYQPDILTSISDEISSSMASNRARKSSQRSIMWLDEMQKQFSVKGANSLSKTLFFASVQGGGDLDQRKQSAYQLGLRDETAKTSGDPNKRIDGFVIGGLGAGEDFAKRNEIVETVVNMLPASKPRVLSSTSAFHGSPEEILSAVSQGIDLFEIQYTHQLTLLGQAAVFQFENFDSTPLKPDFIPETKLHLRDSKYAHDKSPILAGCTCFTCTNHTRAYLNHLLNVHEMTAPVLLDLHNIHHYTKFLETIRTKLASSDRDAFKLFKQQFLQHFKPSSDLIPTAVPVHANEVGRALLGPFTPIIATVGDYAIRHILPKDNAQVAAIIREVMPSFGCDGPGFAIHDREVDEMYQAYETPGYYNKPTTTAATSTDATTTPMEIDSSATSSSSSTTTATPPPLRSAYFVITRVSDDSVVLGGGGLMALAGMDGTIAELRKMYFLPSLRGQGFGQRIMDLCIEHAKKFGFKQLYLETMSSMTAAQFLYRKNGFKPLDAHLGNTGHFACDMRYIKDL